MARRLRKTKTRRKRERERERERERVAKKAPLISPRSSPFRLEMTFLDQEELRIEKESRRETGAETEISP